MVRNSCQAYPLAARSDCKMARRQALLLLLVTILSVFFTAAADIERAIRDEWRVITTVCPDTARRYRSCETVDKSNWTDGKLTRRSDMVQLDGRWLTFKLETFDQKGAKKTQGGDSWFVILRDPVQKTALSTRVFDNADGTYTVAVVILSPGNYSVLARLWYSDCHGVQEPALGEDQPLVDFHKNLQPKDHCHIGTRVRFKNVFIEPGHAALQTCATCELAHAAAKQQLTSGTAHASVTRSDYYYHRQDRHLKSTECCKPRLTDPPNPNRVFLCGDSTLRQQWSFYLWTARKPCRWEDTPRWFEELFEPNRCPPAPMSEVDPELDKVYRRCTGGADWSTIPIGATAATMAAGNAGAVYFDLEKYEYNRSFAQGKPIPREFGLAFMDGWGTQTLKAMQILFFKPLRAGDMIVINSGPHPSRTLTFVEFQLYLDKIANELHRVKTLNPGVRILWRSSNIWKEHVFRNTTFPPHSTLTGYISTGHFNTFIRGQLFDSYAEDVMRWAGIDVWDVYTITTLGDNRPWDMIHVDANTIRALDYDLLDQFTCKAETT